MKLPMILLSVLMCLGLGYRAWSEDKHDHGKKEKKVGEHGHAHEEGEEEDHANGETDEHGHAHKEGEKEVHAEGKTDEHGEGEEHKGEAGEGGHGHEEGGSVVGPDKGIIEKGALGIKLSPEAVSTIQPEMIPWQAGSMSIPYLGLVRIKESKSVYRVRNGFYKRVPVTVESRQGEKVTIRVPGLAAGDQIVISQTGFLRIAEVITEEGASHSHAH